MAEFNQIDQGQPIEVAGQVGLVPMLFEIIPEDPEEEMREVYSIQKYVRTTDIEGNESWRDADQALWVSGRPRQLAEAFSELAEELQQLDHPSAEMEEV